jgi:hypothetical protein
MTEIKKKVKGRALETLEGGQKCLWIDRLYRQSEVGLREDVLYIAHIHVCHLFKKHTVMYHAMTVPPGTDPHSFLIPQSPLAKSCNILLQ